MKALLIALGAGLLVALAGLAFFAKGKGPKGPAVRVRVSFLAKGDVREDEVEVRYDDGFTATYARRPRRIVTTLPGLTEMVAFLGAAEQLVGVTEHCDHPPGIQEGRTAVSVMPLDIEGILGLEPDLVIVDRTLLASVLPDLRARVPSVLALETSRSLMDLEHSVTLLGSILGEEGVRRAMGWFGRMTNQTLSLHAARPARAPRVLVLGGFDPLNAVGSRGLFHDMLTRIGAENVAADLDAPSGPFAEELVLERRPEWILYFGPAPTKRLRERWHSVPGMADGRLLHIERDDLLRGGPRIMQALEDLRAVIVGGAAESRLLGAVR
jgi:iron complex transport system substrate-binding protein